MNFSTSSSKGFIVAAVGFGALFIAAYEGLIAAGAIPVGKGIANWDNNVVRVEEMQYGPPKQVVLVGSSITMNLKAADADPEILDLGLRGGCSITGLELLRHAPWRPKLVVVEISEMLELGEDQKVLSANVDPIVETEKRIFRSTRLGYKPTNVLATLYRPSGPTQGPSKFVDQAVDQAIESNRMELSGERLKRIDACFEETKALVDKLAASGIKIALHFVPEDERTRDMPRQIQLTNLAYETFPPQEYTWLRDYRSQIGRTGDGLHLLPDDAGRYRVLLLDQIRLLLGDPIN